MKNKIKKIFVLVLCLFGLTSCATSFCSDTDLENIENGIRNQLDNPSEENYYQRPTVDDFSDAKITYSFDDIGDQDVWDYLTAKEASGDSSATEAKEAYIDYLLSEHPKACLVTEDRKDKTSGGEISGKTFKDAFKEGLLEMLAYPMSYLFVKGAEILGNGKISGASIFFSIVIITFLLRFAITLLTLKSTKQQQTVQAMQPQLEEINKKYANKFDEKSKQLKSMEIMKLYKKYDVNPMSTLITPFITLPVFIAVYSAVKDTTIIFEYSFGSLSLGQKLGKSILNGSWIAIVIFVVMALSQFVTMRLPNWLAKKKQKSYKQVASSGPSQSDIMTYFFLAMILFIGWALPVALSIYWLSSSLYSIAQTFVLDIVNKKGKK